MTVLFIVLLVAHVFAAIMFIGGATIAASIFPRYLGWHWTADGRPANPAGDAPRAQEQVLRALARVTRGYGTGALAVPLLGLALALLHGRLTEGWLNASLVLAAVAAVLLVSIVRAQEAQLRLVHAGTAAPAAEVTARAMRRLRMLTGLFNTVWIVILVLMIWQPGGHA